MNRKPFATKDARITNHNGRSLTPVSQITVKNLTDQGVIKKTDTILSTKHYNTVRDRKNIDQGKSNFPTDNSQIVRAKSVGGTVRDIHSHNRGGYWSQTETIGKRK